MLTENPSLNITDVCKHFSVNVNKVSLALYREKIHPNKKQYFSLDPAIQKKVKASKNITEQFADAAERDVIDAFIKGKTKGVKTRLKGRKPKPKSGTRKTKLKKRRGI